MWNKGYLGYSEIPSIHSANVRGEKFAKTTETGKFLSNVMVKELETWLIRAAPKFDFLKVVLHLKKGGLPQDTRSDTRQHFTVQSAWQNCLVAGQNGI